MNDLHSTSLLNLLPENLKTNEIVAVCKALDRQLKEITNSIIENEIIPRISELPENIVDLLAWQFHIDFYEPIELDINKKRELVKNSIIHHKEKGTKKAVEQLVKTVFFDDFMIEEWFQYGGNPYYFKIIIKEGSIKTKEEYDLLIQAINSAKNIRSHLEKVVLKTTLENKLYFGNSIKRIKKFKINI